MSHKSFVENGQRVIERFAGNLANGKCVFSSIVFFFEADVLDDYLITQIAPVSGFPLARISIVTRNEFRWGCKRLKTDEKRAGRIKIRPAPYGLEASHVRRLEALRTGGHFELDRLAFVQRLVTIRLDGREVDENIFATLALNETKAFTCVEPLHCSLFFHV